jgi:opacity protein-like surface antigen
MRKALVPAGLLLLLPLSLMAQTTPKAEVFGGYSYSRIEETNLHGWNVAMTGNINPNLGITFDFSGHYNKETFTNLLGQNESKLNFHTFMIGPHVVDRSSKWFAPFAHALLGFSRINIALNRTGNPATATSQSISQYGFAMALGGGLDVAGDKPISFRAVQIDYFLLRAEDLRHEGLRLSTGVIFRLGQRKD